jgi:IS5 family transposase
MPRIVTPLTATKINNAKAPVMGAKPIKLRDGDGLYLLVKSDGSRRWCWDYSRPVTGKRNTLGLGTYPEVGLAAHQRSGRPATVEDGLHRPRRPDHRCQHRDRADSAQPARGERDDRAGPDAGRLDRCERAQKDVDARWTHKHGKSYYGYKLHANTDRRWGFIRRLEVTPDSVSDTRVFETIVDETNTSRDVYADRGYAKAAREVALREQGYRDRIQRKGQADRPSSPAQQRRNRGIARERAFGEPPFARLTQMGGKSIRTIGLVRARAVIELKVIAHNLMHLARLQKRGIVPA